MKFVIKDDKQEFEPQNVYNKHNTTWKVLVQYIRTRCFCIRNLTRSLRLLVRFLIRQQPERKYRAPALSMKYSLHIHIYLNNDSIKHVHDRSYSFFSRLYALHNSVSKLKVKSFFG